MSSLNITLVMLVFDSPLTYCIKKYCRKLIQLFGIGIWLDLKSDSSDTGPSAHLVMGLLLLQFLLMGNSTKKKAFEKMVGRIMPQKTCRAVSHDLSVVRAICSVGKHIMHTSQQWQLSLCVFLTPTPPPFATPCIC